MGDPDKPMGMMWWTTVAGRRSPGGCLTIIAFTLLVVVAIVEGWFW